MDVGRVGWHARPSVRTGMRGTSPLCAMSSLALVASTENANQFENRIVAINCYVACRTRRALHPV